MKSIVLCENNLVEHNVNTKDIKTVEINENSDEKLDENKLINGSSCDERSEFVIKSCEDEINFIQNGNGSCSNEVDEKMVCEPLIRNGDIVEVSDREPFKSNPSASDKRTEIDNTVKKSREESLNNLFISMNDKNCIESVLNKENLPQTKKNYSENNIKSKNDSMENTPANFSTKEDISNTQLANNMVLCNGGEKKILDKSFCNITQMEEVSTQHSENIDDETESELKVNEVTEKVTLKSDGNSENSHMVKESNMLEKFNEKCSVSSDIINKDGITQEAENCFMEVDEDKENKNDPSKEINQVSENDNGDTMNYNKDEFSVEGFKSVSDAEKNESPIESEVKGSFKTTNENSYSCKLGKIMDLDKSFSQSDQILEMNIIDKKEEFEDKVESKCVLKEVDVDKGEKIHFGMEEIHCSGQESLSEEKETSQSNCESNENKITSGDSDKSCSMDIQVDILSCRKRQVLDNNDINPSPKKIKLSESDDEAISNIILEKNENENDSEDLSGGFSSADAHNDNTIEPSKCGQNVCVRKKTSCNDSSLKKEKTNNLDEETQRFSKEKVSATSTFLASLRGTLKSLTRSDLEELLVQKLCEVITERSTVGELRRKAQTLEQDQEKWKEKVHSLTKQMREMDMVMKKYMTEVQKQTKDPNSQMVTPLRVTRSVGLQVSFYSSANKLTKQISGQGVSSTPVQSVNNRNTKISSTKPPPQLNVMSPPVRNKSAPPQKISPQQKLPVNQQKKLPSPRNDFSSGHHNRAVPQSVLNSNRTTSNQVQVRSPNFKSPPSSQMTQQQQQLQQNGSKVIDLTDDDDRQMSPKSLTQGSTAKPSGPVRVVSNLTQPQVPQNNRFAYLLPTASTTSTGSSSTQSRQVLIATPTVSQPNRQLMCPMPPLLFKGGNVVQPASQPQMVNQSNRVIFPKTSRHPAPLPQTPVNQINRPNLKLLPPRPALKISKVQTGIVLSWNMTLGPEYAPISSYQLYAYQESNTPPSTSLWKKVGDVKALPLPMACTLTQFMSGHKYHFAVRAVDLHSRIGPFSFPGTIVLVK